jgi:hypothetical protein
MQRLLSFALDFQPMFTKTVLIGRKRRLLIFGIVLGVLAALALSPLLLGMVMMTIEEATTGKNVGEHNSVWGVLPWLTMGTMVIFGGPLLIVLKLMLLGLFYDGIFIALERRGKRRGDIEADVLPPDERQDLEL